MAGATPLGNMVIKLGLDDADFGKGVANSKKQVQYLAKEMQANMKIADMAGNKLGKLGTRYDGLTQIIRAQENQVTALKKAYDGSFVDGKATDSTKRLANQLQDANGKLANYKLQLQNTAGQMARLQVETQGVTGWLKQHGDAYIKQGEKIQKFGGMVSKAGTALTVGVTAPIVAGATAVTKAAIDWESAFAGVKKTSDEVVDSNGNVVYSYADLETSLRGLAKELPSTHSEIAAVAEAAGQLGIQTQDITAFTKTMIDMGESTNLSAEDAATAIAKIANITGMTSSEYQRFGSSVVALGNNFATTEADIVQMSNRLASAGTLAGLSNQEILGLATAMSSVGIEAEAGGTAMTQTLTAIEKAAVEGGDSLDQFAKVAGMSSSEFAKQWNEKPIEAIQSFIKALGELDGKGESATLMLDEMGLSGVRQSNMLKSLALASDTLSGAVDMSTQAWEENTALTNEAGTRYETTESKLKMLRNEAVDAAIEFGGPLVDALRDGLEASKPLIKSFGDMAKAFSSLDKEQQQNIIKWGLMAAAAGPALKLLGGGISTIGSVTKGVGKLSTGIVKLVASAAEKKAIAGLATSITGVGTAATTAVGTGTAGAAAGGLAGLGTAIAGLAGPIAIGVTALGAVAGAVYLGKKAFDEHQLAGAKWGTAVTEEQDKVISKSYELREKAVGYINEYADGVKGSADKAIEANNAIVDSIQATIDKEYERNKKNAEKVENESIQSSLEQQAENDKQYGEQLAEQAKKRVDRINKILSDASKNSRELSDQERSYIEANYNQLSDKQLELAGLNAEQRIAIESAYQDKLSKLTDKQLEDRANSVGKALNEEQAKYEKEREAIIEGTKNNVQRQKELLGQLDKEHRNSSESMILGLAKLRLEQGYSLEQMSAVWEQYGWTVDEVAELVNSSVDDTTKNLDMLAKGTEEADIQWNQMALDPKTGEVRTNMADVLKEMASTDEGWQQLKFIAKNADISTNAKEEIAIAMGESGKWNELYLTEKLLLVDGDQAQVNLYDTIEEMGLWNEYNADRKTLGVDNADAIWKTMDAQGKLGDWNELSPELKTLLANDPAKLTVEQTTKALSDYNNLDEDFKTLLANNTNAVANIGAANTKLNHYNETKVGAKHLHATADYSEVERAKAAIAQVYSKNVVIDVEYRGRRTGQTAIPNAKGTNYHPGGDMIVNDQSGPLYKELVQFPGQAPFIPQGRNVYIPNAPAGTKVARASVTKSIMRRLGIPKYADGVGIPEDSSLVRNLRSLTPATESSSINFRTQDYSKQFEMLIDIMSNFGEDLRNMQLILDGRNVMKSIETRQTNHQKLNDIKAGRRTI
ncbi:phage tail tape measure protein [Enterococcus casseliflavus]|uniref:phage tail tape measure protein n=1 Tax=Enterococcus casseliflavus TaxID=37734 RepID=UPI001F1AB55E|nr:phage tail tape measure protein [Enterococcus casseliflavus]